MIYSAIIGIDSCSGQLDNVYHYCVAFNEFSLSDLKSTSLKFFNYYIASFRTSFSIREKNRKGTGSLPFRDGFSIIKKGLPIPFRKGHFYQLPIPFRKK